MEKREDIQAQQHQPHWHVTMDAQQTQGTEHRHPDGCHHGPQLEQTKARIRAKVEHPFRVIKCQFGYRKTKYKGLAKNAANLLTLFALSSLWLVRNAKLNMGAMG